MVDSMLYPLMKSHMAFPITAPIAPYGPNNIPEIGNSPTWGATPCEKLVPVII